MIHTALSSRLVAMALASLCVLAASTVAAQPPSGVTEADVMNALIDGDVARAAELAALAFGETRAPWAALRLAQAEAARGRWLEADAALREITDTSALDREEVESLRTTVDPYVTRLRVDVTPAGATMRVNGAVSPLGTEIRVERNAPVVIVVQAEGHETATLRFVPTSEVERRTVRLVAAEAVQDVAVSPRTRGRPTPLTWVLAGTAIAISGTALGTGMSTRNVYDDLESGCGREGCSDEEIADSGLMPRARATTALLLLAGATATSSLLVGLLVRKTPRERPAIDAMIGPMQLGLVGRF